MHLYKIVRCETCVVHSQAVRSAIFGWCGGEPFHVKFVGTSTKDAFLHLFRATLMGNPYVIFSAVGIQVQCEQCDAATPAY